MKKSLIAVIIMLCCGFASVGKVLASGEQMTFEDFSDALLENKDITSFLITGMDPNVKINPKNRDQWGAGVKVEALLYAAYNGQSKNVNALIKHGANLNVVTQKNKNNALILAVMGVYDNLTNSEHNINGYPGVVKLLLDAGLAIDYKNKAGYDAKYFTRIDKSDSARFQAKLVSGLLDVYGGNNNINVNKNELSLFVSILEHDIAGINLAAQNGVNFNVSLYDFYAVELAASLGDEDTLKALLSSDNVDIKQALSYSNTESIAKILISRATNDKVNKYISDNYSLELLNIAKQDDFYRSNRDHGIIKAKYFLAKGANPNIIDKKSGMSLTPISYAVMNNNIELIKLLLENKANPNSVVPYKSKASFDDIVDKVGRRTRFGYYANARTPILLNSRLSYIKNDIAYYPLIAYAVHNNNINLVKLLLQFGASVEADDDIFGNILNSAIADEQFEIISLLLDKCKNINKYTNLSLGDYGKLNTMQLATSMKSGSDKIIKRLIEKGIGVNSLDFNGNPLMFTVISLKSIDLLNFFVFKNANINIFDKNGKSLVVYASDINNSDAVKFLLKVGVKVPPIYEYAIKSARSWNFDQYYYWMNKASIFNAYNEKKANEAIAIFNKENRRYNDYQEEKIRLSRIKSYDFQSTNQSINNNGQSLPKQKGLKSVVRDGMYTVVECYGDDRKWKIYHDEYGKCTYPLQFGTYSCETALEWTKNICNK